MTPNWISLTSFGKQGFVFAPLKCSVSHRAFQICLQSIQYLAVSFQSAVDYTCMRLFDRRNTTVPHKKWTFLKHLEVGWFANTYSSRHLKGIVEEGAGKEAPVVYMRRVANFVFVFICACLLF